MTALFPFLWGVLEEITVNIKMIKIESTTQDTIPTYNNHSNAEILIFNSSYFLLTFAFYIINVSSLSKKVKIFISLLYIQYALFFDLHLLNFSDLEKAF